MIFGPNSGRGTGLGFVPISSDIMPTDGLIGLERPFIQGQAAVPGLDPAAAPAASAAPLPISENARLTPEQLALREKANAGWRPDYSPVQSWTQGLARVADAWVHASEQRRLEKEAAAIGTDRTNSIAALLARDASSSPTAASRVAAALASSDPTLQKLGMWRLEQDNPKPADPSDLQQRVEYLDRFSPGLGGTYAQNYAANGGGAPQFVTTSQGTFMVPRTPAAAPPPSAGGVPDAAVSFLRSNPGTAAQFDAKYGAGASSRYLGGAAPQAQAPFATQPVRPGQ